jgi:hypothetical protein
MSGLVRQKTNSLEFVKMAFEQRDVTGTLFRNVSTNEKAPSHKGKVIIGGIKYPIAVRITEGVEGRFFSIKVQDPNNERPVS